MPHKLNRANQLDSLVHFFRGVSHGSADMELKVAVDSIRANVKWFARSYDSIARWLRTRQKEQNDNEQLDQGVEAVKAEGVDYRLPTNLRPLFYDLRLRPYIGFDYYDEKKSFTFDGHLNLTFVCETPTDRIVMHSKFLTLNRSTIRLHKIVRNYYL